MVDFRPMLDMTAKVVPSAMAIRATRPADRASKPVLAKVVVGGALPGVDTCGVSS